MFKRRTLAACCVLAVPYAACLAQSTFTSDQYFDNRWYLTPFGTYINSDNARRADDGWGGGLSIGKAISPYWNIELRTQYEQLDATSGGPGEYKNWSASLDAQWFFMGRQGFRVWQAGSVQPYLVAGIGAIDDKIKGPGGNDVSETSFMANAGAGIVWPFASWGRLVADARYRYDDNRSHLASGGHMDDWLFSVGLQIPLGPAPRVAQAPPPSPPPAATAPPPPPPPAQTTRVVDIKADGTFAFDKAVLTPTGRTRIDGMLQEYKSAGFRPRSVVIVGYTDPLGSNEYNQRLSLARANAVRDHLVNQGVSAGVIQTEGHGETDLRITEAECKSQGKAKNRTALIACLEPNRRVEIRATGEQAL
ncbi:OmpA family protein [Variovorax sp. J22R133]|uniref:OmpA family protein n=1 Tax=Variovorax brevis TaxID=3053503 RepID=UPI0025767BE1|nr:OmpA family protein [Variovorax sp. J22R133]MDM0118037.1 OmpA family protein [Variovorax sp. J22R133]